MYFHISLVAMVAVVMDNFDSGFMDFSCGNGSGSELWLWLWLWLSWLVVCGDWW